MTKIELFLELCNPSSDGKSRKVYATEFIGKYSSLKSGNGYKWPEQLKGKFKFNRGGSGDNWFIELIGVDVETGSRMIRNDIRMIISRMKCEHTGFEGISSDGIEVDHRNGRYNEPSVLNVETQTIDDFMPLTRRANLFKRGNACNPCKSTGKRYDAKLLGYPISVSEGTLNYDENLGCVGCYWYSPINFRNALIK